MTQAVRKVQLLKHPNGKSPNWYLRWWEPTSDGTHWKEKWRSTRTTTKKDAERQRRELERELDAGKQAESEITWDDFVEEFVKTHVARKRRATMDLYRYRFDALGRFGMPKKLAQVNHAVLEDFVGWRLSEEKTPAAATVNRDLRHIRAALRWAKRRGYIPDIPDFKGIFLREDRRKPVIIPEEDFLAIIKSLRKPNLDVRKCSAGWWRVFLYVAYYLGLRRGEILGLTWSEVDFTTLEVKILASTSKARSERTIPMAPKLAEILKQWREGQEQNGPSDHVLPWPHGNYRHLYDDWHAIMRAAGIQAGQHYVPKNCRSSCASGLIAANVPTVVVKDFLGHSSVTTTENYYINTRPALRAAAAAREVRLEEDESAKARSDDKGNGEKGRANDEIEKM